MPPSRTRDAGELITLGLLLAFLAVALGPALLGRGVFLDVGLLHRYLPFRVLGPVDPSIWCRGDTVDGVLPGINEIRDGLRHGRLITWSPYEAGGAPLASLPNHGLLNPVAWPYLVLPLWLAPAYVKLLQCIVAVGGMVGFLGRLGVSRTAAWLAGLVFISSGFMVMWTNWPQAGVACWIPALFWAVHRTVSRRRPVDVGLLSLVVAAMLFGGFPAVTMYALVVAGVMALVMAVRMRTIQGVTALLCAAAGVLLGGAISAVQLVPFLADLGAVNLESRDFTSIHPEGGYLLTTVAPQVWGSCVDGAVAGPQNPIESTAFVGAGAAVLSIAALAVRRRHGRTNTFRWFFAIVAVVITLAMWVGGPVLDVVQSLPFFGSNPIGRAASILGFLAAVLAAIGFDRLRARQSFEPTEDTALRPPVAVTICTLIATVVAIAWGLVSGHTLLTTANDPNRWAELLGRLAVPAAFLLIALVAALVAAVGPSKVRTLATLTLAAVIAVQSIAFVRVAWPLSHRDDFYPVTQTHRFLQKHLGGSRFASSNGVLYPATADMYGLRTPLGHQFTAPAWRDLLEAVDPTVMRSPTYSDFAALDLSQVAKDPVLDRLAVRYWVTDPGNVEGVLTPQPAHTGAPTTHVRSGEHLTCVLPAGPTNGIAITNLSRSAAAPDGLRVHIRIRSTRGASVSGVRAFPDTIPAGELRIALRGGSHDVRRGSTAEVWFTGLTKPLRLRGGRSGLACSSLRPSVDRLALVSAEPGALVYERMSALPRVRWAGTSTTVAERKDRISFLKAAPSRGPVVLADPGAGHAAGSTATVDVLADTGSAITARVRASGDGYLVVADSLLRDGWHAKVDGRPTAIVSADHALAGVPVTSGTHTVRLHYSPPGWPVGPMISALALLLTIALLGFGALRSRSSDTT